MGSLTSEQNMEMNGSRKEVIAIEKSSEKGSDSGRQKFMKSRNLEILQDGYVRVDVIVCLLLTFLEDSLWCTTEEKDNSEESNFASPFHLLLLHSVIEDLLSLWGGSKSHSKVSKGLDPCEKDDMAPSVSVTPMLEPSSPDVLEIID